MASARKTLIIDNVVDALGAIAEGATYNRTVRVATRQTYVMSELRQFDAVFVYDAGETKRQLAHGVTEAHLRLLLDCWIREKSDNAQAVDDIAADVERALLTDCTRGGYAIDTVIVAIRTSISEGQVPEGNCEIEVEIVYRHAWGNPYAAA